ncbi:MAG: putative ABC transport system ATP-binding protein [Parcubacteria bacterium C7867-005]|nr:MAG: putative ABC transport system ATP-binding protein [Parcubacteria bacterium C7867-005]
MIEVKNLVKKFESGEGVLLAVNNVSFSVSTGEFVAITGRSGSGKSTLMYQLGLLDHPSEGRIIIDGEDITDLPHHERTSIRLNSLGYVFQDYALLPELSAIENVLIPLLMQGLPQTEALEKAKNSLVRIGLGDRLHHLPSQLSGGQQQRVSIARAIAHDPKIIFADEPTANLDSESSLLVLKNFIELNNEGQTILMVTHEPEYAAMAHRVITLSDGEISSDKWNKIK